MFKPFLFKYFLSALFFGSLCFVSELNAQRHRIGDGDLVAPSELQNEFPEIDKKVSEIEHQISLFERKNNDNEVNKARSELLITKINYLCIDYSAEKILNPSWSMEDKERRAKGLFSNLCQRPITKSAKAECNFADTPGKAFKYCENWPKSHQQEYKKIVRFLNEKKGNKVLSLADNTCQWSEKLKPRLLKEAQCSGKDQGICTGFVVCHESGKTFKTVATCSMKYCNNESDSALKCRQEKGFKSEIASLDTQGETESQSNQKTQKSSKTQK